LRLLEFRNEMNFDVQRRFNEGVNVQLTHSWRTAGATTSRNSALGATPTLGVTCLAGRSFPLLVRSAVSRRTSPLRRVVAR
jgi:hypothetical protein